MIDLTEIYKRDDVLFGILQKISMSDAMKCFQQHNYPKTGQVMATFVVKTNFLKTAIFDLCESDNLYSANIIFRSLIEHMLKAQYVFMKWVEDKNDNVGDNYLCWYEASEFYDYIKSWEAAFTISKSKEMFGNSEEKFYEMRPDLAQKSIKEIKLIADQFKYRSIIKYMNNRGDTSDKPAKDSFFVKDYTKLC